MYSLLHLNYHAVTCLCIFNSRLGNCPFVLHQKWGALPLLHLKWGGSIPPAPPGSQPLTHAVIMYKTMIPSLHRSIQQ